MARRRVVKTRFYALTAVAIVVIITIVVLVLTGGGGEMLDTGYIETSMEATAVIIRDEECIAVEKHDRVIYAIDEGADVNEGDVIGSVYKWGYTDERMQSLISVQKEILAEQKNLLAGVANSELAELEAKIEQKINSAKDIVMMGSDGDLLSYEKELEGLLAQRSELLKKIVQPNEKLEQLYVSEQQQVAQLNEWRGDVTASSSGRVSFYFDGYEQALSVQKLGVVNSELISTVIKNSNASNSATINDNVLLYKIVSPTLWYIAYSTSVDSSERTVKGVNYTLVFDGYEDITYTGVALEPIVEDKKIVNIIEIKQDIGDFINIRNAHVTLVSGASGLEISAAMLDIRDGSAFVNVVTSNSVKPVEVEILVSDGERVIIKAKNSNDVLAAGMRCKKP